jgi:hypothetical protein
VYCVVEDDAGAPDPLEVGPTGLLELEGRDVTAPAAELVRDTAALDEDDGKTELHFVLDFLELDEGPTVELELEKDGRVEMLELEDPMEVIVPPTELVGRRLEVDETEVTLRLTELVGARLDVDETEVTVPFTELEESTLEDEGFEEVEVTLPELLLDEIMTEPLLELEETEVTVPLDELALNEDVGVIETTEDDVKLTELDWETELLVGTVELEPETRDEDERTLLLEETRDDVLDVDETRLLVDEITELEVESDRLDEVVGVTSDDELDTVEDPTAEELLVEQTFLLE